MNSWPMRDRTPNRHPFVDYELALPLDLTWTFEAAGPVHAQVIASEGLAFVLSTSKLHALRMETGEEVWSFKSRQARLSERFALMRGNPAIAGANIYLTDEGGTLNCLEKATGTLLWESDEYKAGNEALAAYDDTLILKTRRSPEGGSSLMDQYGLIRLGLDQEVLWFAESGGRVFTEQPAISHGVVVYGDQDGFLNGVDVDNGEPLWRTDVRALVKPLNPDHVIHAYGMTSIIGSTAIMRVGTHQVFGGFDVSTGEVKWIHESGALSMNGAGDESYFYYVTHTDEFRAVDIETGELRMSVDNSEHRFGSSNCHSALVVGDKHIAGFNESHKIAAFGTSDGKVKWEYETKSIINAAPMFVDGKIIVGDGQKTVYCFEEM